MDSLSMNNLASSLPPPARNDELNGKFKDAALSITTLYRASLAAQQRAHNAGYAAALQDVLSFVQTELSTSGQAMDVGAVMDWVEARAASVVEDPDVVEEVLPAPVMAKVQSQKRLMQHPHPHPTTATAKENQHRRGAGKHSSMSTSPSPPPPTSRAVPVLPASKKHLHQHRDREPESTPPSPVLGTKRRHRELGMVGEFTLPPPAQEKSETQRTKKGKPKSSRVPNPPLPPVFGMDVDFDEEMGMEGRERKRVARR
ncbi:hypothetical protein EXIGLDRAFT_728555 [Exidia glandulosa HHB12029]|uniref:Uncharacterized protein n=1 Tax=Exidia glandulosa HHB12029 TaxID=1314781 RepID=A0A165Q327_EXIGL|nr:hypothetical protein EXIGLDRAFT_728555 [Exidia glandulosa HHB12029]